ncbi:SRPBCC family protein [Streptomyces sp. NPDC099050]|uniref:SRPBCC family protein n=1 Tax=Streptomyces sp. NPDC099050 TaxID=3366100 RepID=UPI00382D44A5
MWTVLADATRYGEWVVGPSESTPLDRYWPEVGSRLRCTVRLGPWSADGVTTVRRREPGRSWNWRFRSRFSAPRGSSFSCGRGARTPSSSVRSTPCAVWEAPSTNPATEALIHLRHRGMLARLARVVEQDHDRARHA